MTMVEVFFKSLLTPIIAIDLEFSKDSFQKTKLNNLKEGQIEFVLNSKSYMAHIQLIDLVVVNLYPFVQEAVKNNLPMEKAIEFIDIGGPSMLRAAAKNYHSVNVLSDTQDYQIFMDNFKDNEISLDCRKTLAAKVFQRT